MMAITVGFAVTLQVQQLNETFLGIFVAAI
jgi:hypothetical protein